MEEQQKKKLEVVRLNRHISTSSGPNNKFIKKQALKVKSAIECIQQIQAEGTYGSSAVAEMNNSVEGCIDKTLGKKSVIEICKVLYDDPS